MAREQFDALVVGAGQAGVPLAAALARSGRRTALIERSHVGGTCINEGCTPTKTMVASARVAYLARRAGDYGVGARVLAVDLGRVRQRKRDIVEHFRAGSERRIADAGVTLVRAEARFAGPGVMIARDAAGVERELAAPWIFLNAGERPVRPPLPGLDSVPHLDSTSIMELDGVPEHLLVLGGGYIGLEFGQMFRRFGSRVTIVQRGPRLLAREDGDVADAVAEIMRQDGIEVLLSTDTLGVEERARGGVALTVNGPAGARVLEGSHLLVAVGRRPNTEALGLDAAGVATDARGYVVANQRLETSAAGIWALGDIKGPPAFTHISYDDYRILRANLLQGGPASTAGRVLPYTVFIDPQLGRVGMTEAEARASGREVRCARLPMAHVARALELDETRGFMKAMVDMTSGEILGAAVLGIEGGELAAALQIAMLGRLPYTALRDGVFAHPTLAESFNNLFAQL